MEGIVKEAREAMSLSWEFDRDNRAEAMDDLRFVAGFQWSDAAKAERANRPMITINRSSQFLRQVSNPIRQNMPTIKVEPDSDDQSAMAEIANGLFRRIQYNSSASHVYAAATEHMVGCGIGWFRIGTDYLDDEGFDQEIVIKRVFNPLSVYPDPSALEPNRSDMNWAVVSELIPAVTFKKRWPGKAVEGMDTGGDSDSRNAISWGSSDYVRVAEYWRRKETSKTVALLTTGEIADMDLLAKVAPQYMDKIKPLIVNSRKIKTHSVEMVLLSGVEQLEDAYECPCRWIPLVPVIGAEIPLDKGIYRHGLIRFQREPQQLHNYFMSVAAETLGQQPKAPYVVTKSQIKGYEQLWDTANQKPRPYLIYNPDSSSPPPQRVEPPPLPAGLITMAQMLSDDMKATTGIYDAALGAKSNETSGVAIGARVEQGNQATFHFVDNLEHSLEHAGRIILDMMPKVYDNQRAMRLRSEDDTERTVMLNQPTIAVDGQAMLNNDMSQMSFKAVRVVMGPSYASRRQEAVAQLTQLVTALPQVGAVGADLIVKNMDFDGSEQLSERLKAVLPPQILQIENPELAQPQGPDPMQEMQMQGASQMMEFELAGAEAKAGQEQAKAAQEAAKVEGAQLDNALKVKKLREPPPRPGNGSQAGSQNNPPDRRVF